MSEHQGKAVQLYLRSTGKPMEVIAKELGISRTTLYGYFKSSQLDPVFAQMLNNHGYSFQKTPAIGVQDASPAYGPLNHNNIIYIPLFAYGGFLHGYSNKVFMDSLERFSLPGIHGEHFAFEVQGSSMAPHALPGDIVISRKEEKLEWMIKGRAYVLQTVDGILLKIFDKIDGGKAHFKSADKNHSAPSIPLKDIKGVYQVVKVLKDFHSIN